MEPTRIFKREKFRLLINKRLTLLLAFITIAIWPVIAQDIEVPRTRTFPGIENPAFPYAQPEEVGISSDKLNRLGDEIESWVANGELIGAELLIIKDKQTVFHEAYGWADREEKNPVERNSIWSIQSMSKSFTATAILMLSEEGRLSLNDPVNRYIPAFPDNSTKIHHLLSQTSGFDVTDEIIPAKAADFESLRAWVKVLMMDKRAAPLGTYRYTDYNYNFLGQIVEEASGQPADQFIKEHILQPIGMEETFTAYAPEVAWANRMNSRYRWNEDARDYSSYWTRRDEQPWPFFPASHGLFSTAMDYSKFMSVWMNKGKWEDTRLLPEPMINEALRNHGVIDEYRGYGYGWFIRGPQHEERLPHSFFHGGIDGTLALAFPAENVVIVFLTHSRGRQHRTALVNRLDMLEILDGPGPYTPNLVLAKETTVEKHQLKPEERALYEGTYRGESSNNGKPFGPVVRVWEEAGRLHFRIGELGELAYLHLHLVPMGNHRFSPGRYRGNHLEGIDPYGKIQFIIEAGEVKRLEVGTDENIQFSAQPADPEQLLAVIKKERNRKRIDVVILKTLKDEGIDAAQRIHRELIVSPPDSVRFGENLLNTLGYRLLKEESIEEAIAVFKMNLEAYPEKANPYDSLGDAYREAGRLEDAKQNYRRAVELAKQQGNENLETYREKLKQVIDQLEKQ